MAQSADTLRLVFITIRDRAARMYEEIRQAVASRAPAERLVSMSHDIRQLKEFAMDVLYAGKQVCRATTKMPIDRAQADYLTTYMAAQTRLQGALQDHRLLCVMPDTVVVDYTVAPRLQLTTDDQVKIREMQPEDDADVAASGLPEQAVSAGNRTGASASTSGHDEASSTSRDASGGARPRAQQPVTSDGDHLATSAPAGRCWCCGIKPAHQIDRCREFTGLLVNDRATKARQNSQCFRCLAGKHRMLKCPNKMTCDLCRGYHHALLHHAKRTTQPGEQSEDDDDDGEFHPDVPTGKIKY